MITFMGLLAGALTTFSLVPQLIQIIRTRHTKDLSLKTYIILTIGVLLWLIYGLFIHDFAVIIANALTLMLAGCIVLYKIRFG